jgi:hypothetical protein
MSFSIVEKSEVPSDLMDEFYEEGGDRNDFGTTRYRAESDKYDTYVILKHNSGEKSVVGTSDLLEPNEESKMGGCYILPDSRGLSKEGKSAFEHAAERKVRESSYPVSVSATASHGASQHVYEEKFGFKPLEVELPRSDQDPLHVKMIDEDSRRNFSSNLYAPEEFENLVNYLNQEFDADLSLDSSDQEAVSIDNMENVNESGYGFIKLGEGESTQEDLVNTLHEVMEGSVNATVEVDASNPSSYTTLETLLEEDFKPLGYRPENQGSQYSPEPKILMGYTEEPIEAELTEKSTEFLEKMDWDVEVTGNRENSKQAILR